MPFGEIVLFAYFATILFTRHKVAVKVICAFAKGDDADAKIKYVSIFLLCSFYYTVAKVAHFPTAS